MIWNSLVLLIFLSNLCCSNTNREIHWHGANFDFFYDFNPKVMCDTYRVSHLNCQFLICSCALLKLRVRVKTAPLTATNSLKSTCEALDAKQKTTTLSFLFDPYFICTHWKWLRTVAPVHFDSYIASMGSDTVHINWKQIAS